MAPSRRRGAGRGSAAAARRQWKVGDLVLAKLKGFPAWPATVSEPQKWGYKSDLKRILVQFFGTQQIALCYAADIEPFTEEKKRSLLTKRQGKSADFVRALEEIIDSFDKAKKQDHVDFSSGEALANGGNSIRVQNETTGATVMQVETLTFRKDPTVSHHNSTDFPPGFSSDDKESSHEKPVSNLEKPIMETYTSRKRTGGSRSRKCAPQQKVPSPETSKSLPQLASVSVQNSASLSQSSTESVGNLLSDRTREGSVWSTKCIRKTPDAAEGENWDTSAFVSNDSIEYDVSEIITADSDSCGLNDVGTVDSGYKQYSVPDNGIIVEVGANITGLNLQLMSENGKESKGDGDEHLPLLKRARVRMGGVSSSRDVTVELSVNKVEQVTSSVNSNVHCPGSIDLALNETSNTIPGGKILLSKVSDNQCFGHLADGESALPPSKRLHRALEAMSANVAEETSTRKQCTNDVAPGDLEKIKIVEQSQDSLCYRVPVLRLSCNKALEVGMGSSPSADSSTKTIDISYGNEASKNELAENMEHGNDMDILALEQNADHAAPVEEQISGSVMLVAEKQPASLESYQIPLEQQQLFIAKDGEPENQQSNDERTATGALHVVEVVEGNMKKLCQGTADDTECDNAEPQMSILDDNHPVDGEHKPERDDQMQKEASGITFSDDYCSYKDALPMQPAIGQAVEKSPEGMSPATTSVCHMSTSESVNFNQNSGSSSPKNDLNERRFIGSTPTDEEKIDSAAPQRPKSVGIYSNAEVRAALSSFERMLELLTRTRESISHATHMAMDCSKLGASRKIMDILACNLEHESSLHRRVDLFFLVDSIAQSSRGFKGVVGAFPSAVQAVLPLLLLAAAPPGILAKENRRQCLKVLRVWLDRRILPGSILRQHIRDLESLCTSSSAVYSRRSARTERSLDDPIREMEGMHVDEYGSNSSFPLPGLCMPLMLKDEEEEGSDSDGGSFEAVTPEHHCESLPATEKHTHILQDVDGELEMEDVAPFCQEEMSKDDLAVNRIQTSHGQFEQHFPSRYAPPSAQVVPPSSPPLPSSPPPSMPPPLPTIAQPSCATRDAYVDSLDARPSRNAHVQNFQGGPRMNPSASNGVHCRPECRDPVDMQLYDTCKTGRVMNNGHHIDGSSYRHRSHPPRPQHHHLPPPNHLSCTHGGQHVKSRRETPPPPSSSYTHRYHSSHDPDNGRFYNNHDRMIPDPYEYGENWRYYEHPYSGRRYPQKSKSPYGPPLPYGRPSREPTRLPHHRGWEHHPPRGMHHREFMHSQGPVPVSNRGPKMCRHR